MGKPYRRGSLRDRWHRWFRKRRRRAAKVLMPRVAPWILAVISRTWRIECVDEPESVRATGHAPQSMPETHDASPAGSRAARAAPDGDPHSSTAHSSTAPPRTSGGLIAIWHGEMLLGLVRYARRGFRVLVSPSEDGSLVVPVLHRFGYGVIRGSSNEGASRALRGVLSELRGGRFVVITPDGPRGPLHHVDQGLAWLASVTGLPVIPVGMAVDDAWHLRSWDHFTIPRPFARIVLAFGAPVHVARRAAPEELDAHSTTIRERMLDGGRRARERLEMPPPRSEVGASGVPKERARAGEAR
jgi:lysophospholipid acyltransferase (LPLAT)-like uncharacterized protein